MEEAPAAAVEEGLPDDTRDAATSPMPSTSMPPLAQESSSESDDDGALASDSEDPDECDPSFIFHI